jgi:hypothetical protein
MTRTRTLALATALALAGAGSAQAAGSLDCKLDYQLTSWSVIYKHASGEGVIRCENGDSIPVTLTARGGGLTVGKSKIEDGKGEFSHVHEITDLLGNYAQASAHAGLVKSAGAAVLTKGDVQLALAGKGDGVDLGVDVTKLTIKEARLAKRR